MLLLLLLLFAFTLNYKKLFQAEGPQEQLKNNGTNTLHTEWTLNGCVCVCVLLRLSWSALHSLRCVCLEGLDFSNLLSFLALNFRDFKQITLSKCPGDVRQGQPEDRG